MEKTMQPGATPISHLRLRALCEGAIMIALAQILSYVKYELPQGGSISPGLIPIFLYCARWGFGPSMVTSLAYAVLQLIFDGAYAWSIQSIFGDYLIAFTLLGLGGLCYKMKGGFYWGALLATFARFLANYITGATVWAEYMPEEFFGLTMTSPWIYSALYNGFYAVANLALAFVVIALLQRTALKRWIAPAR